MIKKRTLIKVPWKDEPTEKELTDEQIQAFVNAINSYKKLQNAFKSLPQLIEKHNANN